MNNINNKKTKKTIKNRSKLHKVKNHNKNHNKDTKTKKVHFNLRKNKNHKPMMSINKKYSRHHTRKNNVNKHRQYGGNLLPQPITDTIRGGEYIVGNTINSLKGTPLLSSPYPTDDHPIDIDNAIFI
jgi:hypothetical protein